MGCDRGLLPVHCVARYKNTSLTFSQQYAQMTLWSMAKSPLMFGGAATRLDTFTTKLLTNKDVLAVNMHSSGNKQVKTNGNQVYWVARTAGPDAATYVQHMDSTPRAPGGNVGRSWFYWSLAPSRARPETRTQTHRRRCL